MKLKQITVILILLVFLVSLSGISEAQTKLSITGRTRYTLKGDQVTIYAQKLTNYSPVGTHSGSIRIQLWATFQQYTGGTINGYKIAEIDLGVLNGGNTFREINRTVYTNNPPPGSYYMSIVLAEYNRGKYWTADWKNYPKRQIFN